jgi:heme A synthase
MINQDKILIFIIINILCLIYNYKLTIFLINKQDIRKALIGFVGILGGWVALILNTIILYSTYITGLGIILTVISIALILGTLFGIIKKLVYVKRKAI